MLAQFGKIAMSELVSELLSLDPKRLGRDPVSALDALRQNLPSDEDAKQLRSYDGPPGSLGK